MGTQALRRKRDAAFKDANIPVPTDCLAKLIAAINRLEPSPRNDYLKKVVLSKFVSDETDPAITRRTRAMNKWLATEANNSATNDRLITTDPGYNILPGVRWDRFCEWTRGFISRVLGDTVPLDALIGTFSGGASTSRRRTTSHPARKFVGQADITESAMEWFELVLTEAPAWSTTTGSPLGVASLRTVRGSDFFTVPKNTTIDRVACKEPDVNMFLQKGTGNFIRSRLRSFGINLNDQSRNQNLAWLGSLHGNLATLDLSSASDSISCSLVETLLPDLWYSYLNDIRSHVVMIDGEEHCCEMFSSMGNGFTFELESLLFFALAKATAYFGGHRGVISIYGDDIIVPTSASEPLITVLEYMGFETNVEKSFWEGPFRESCGGHYHDGADITPFYIKSPLKTLTDLIHALNQVRLWCSRDHSVFLNDDLWEIWDELSRHVPTMFWGGDVESAGKFQLVSSHKPFKRLSEITDKTEQPPEGQYLMSLLAMRGETPRYVNERKVTFLEKESVNSFSNSSVVVKRCRIKNATSWDWHSSGVEFLTEFNRRCSVT